MAIIHKPNHKPYLMFNLEKNVKKTSSKTDSNPQLNLSVSRLACYALSQRGLGDVLDTPFSLIVAIWLQVEILNHQFQ